MMKPKNWKDLVLIGAAAIALAGGGYGVGYYTQHHQGIHYTENADADTTKHEKTPDEISAEEGIDAEQIVVKITDDGYVTSHGDHFHYFNGKVPYDAIFSDALVMKDKNYKLQQSDIQYEVKDGYVIKVNGQYYLYLKDPNQAKNVRSQEEIKAQREKYTKGDGDKKQDTGHSGSRKNGRYTTDDGYVFSPNDVLEDLGDGYVVPHGDHFHFIPKADLTASEIAEANAHLHGGSKGQATANGSSHNWIVSTQKADGNQNNGHYTTDDGYTFHAQDIIKEVPGGYIVPHGSHYHFIPRNQLSDAEKRAADAFLGKGGSTHNNTTVQPQKPSNNSNNNQAQHTNKPSKPSHNNNSNSHAQKPAEKPNQKPNNNNNQHHDNDQNHNNSQNHSQLTDEQLPLQDLLNKIYKLPKSERHVEADGLIFDPAKVIGKNDFGYIHPHGDHYHIIPSEQLSAMERLAADRVLAKDWSGHKPAEPNKQPDKNEKPNQKPNNDQKPNKDEKPAPDKNNQPDQDEKPTPDKDNQP
ncbi:MAG: pneumococcal-type histidine triad protein, partial [Aerococcus sp.]|nr:pneumococcal-type histidine triad protein [Aerococcus sp.]